MDLEPVPVMPPVEKPVFILPVKKGNNPQIRDVNSYNNLSFEGLPEGSTPARVVRCIELFEHITTCCYGPDKCPEGEACHRTRQVMAHHFKCKNMKTDRENGCNICLQVLALCRNHSDHCQAIKGNCAVPYCKNKKLKEDSNPNEIRTKMLTKDQIRKEYEFVAKKLSEALELPTKQEKLRGIECLLEANRQTTLKVLQYISKKKQISTLNHQMKSLVVGKEIKPEQEYSPQRVLKPKIEPPTLACLLKVIVRVNSTL